MTTRAASILGLAILLLFGLPAGAQPTVKAADAWVQAPAAGGGEAQAFVNVQNGTMYDVYIVGARTDAAAAVELRDATSGKAAAVKEAPVPAFGSLEMSSEGVHLALTGLKRPLQAGETIKIALGTDSGEQLIAESVVK